MRKIGYGAFALFQIIGCQTTNDQPMSIVADVAGTASYVAGECNTTSAAVKAAVITDFVHENVEMLGCVEAFPADPTTCMTTFPDKPEWMERTQMPDYKIRELVKIDGGSAYWLRTSADGRFVAVGNGLIYDLKVPGRQIRVEEASIDPAFSPGNDWYAWIGMICKQKPLYNEDLSTVGPDIADAQCNRNSFNDYASIGYDARGGFLSFTNYSSTNYGSATGMDSYPGGDFATENRLTMRRIDNFDLTGEDVTYHFNGEEDYLLSPSGQLMVGRLVGEDDELRGYRVRMLYPNGSTLNPTDNEAISTICLRGEKPNISFDNRFVTFHHYTESDFSGGNQLQVQTQEQGATDRAANIFIYDLLMDKGYRVTNMPAGSSALFPHFRADGWLIFQVKSSNGEERVMATDAAVVIAMQSDDAGRPISEISGGATDQNACGINPYVTPGGYCYATKNDRRTRVAGSCCEN